MSMTVKPRHSNKKFSRYRRYFSWRVTFWASINSKVQICEGCNFCHLPRNVPHVETFVPLQFMKKTFDQRKNCVIYHIPDYIAKSFANSSLFQFLSYYNYEFFVVLLAKRSTRIKIKNVVMHLVMLLRAKAYELDKWCGLDVCFDVKFTLNETHFPTTVNHHYS